MQLRRKSVPAVVILTLVGVAACAGAGESGPEGSSPVLETDAQKASYAIGLDIGGNLAVAGDRLDVAALEAGLADGLAERESRVPDAELQQAMAMFNQAVQADIEARSVAEASANTAEGDAYRTENGARPGVTTLPSGLQYQVMRPGQGARPGPLDRVVINYRGTLIDGTEFDSSYTRGQPATFGLDGVIPGFSEGIGLMAVGSQYRLVIPPNLAYGPRGSPPTIGPNETLIFEIELLSIERPA